MKNLSLSFLKIRIIPIFNKNNILKLQYYVKYSIIIVMKHFVLLCFIKKYHLDRAIAQGGKIMAKKVRYNGGKESYYRCSAPSKLVVGMRYEVISEKDVSFSLIRVSFLFQISLKLLENL